jgi:hypothetical protein
MAAAALAALLPYELQPGLPQVPHLPPDEVKQVRAGRCTLDRPAGLIQTGRIQDVRWGGKLVA